MHLLKSLTEQGSSLVVFISIKMWFGLVKLWLASKDFPQKIIIKVRWYFYFT